jgi:hypothetical protein
VRTLLKKFAIFFFLLILILSFMNYWMDYESRPHYPLQYEEAFHPKVNADLVILGASHATHGINPRYLEGKHLKVFNFALNGAPPSFYLDWYEKIFRPHYRKPSYVIYAVHWVMFDEKFLPRQLEHDSKYFPFRFFVQELIHFKSLQTLLFNRFAFSKARKQILSMLLHKRRETFPKAGYYNGYIPFKARARKWLKTAVVNPEVDAVEWRAFEELLDDLRKDGIKVIFVQVPGYLPGRDNRNISKNVQLLEGIAKKRGIPFLDYETERISSINTNIDLFADWTHLNEKGSEVFSKRLGQDLKELLKGM